MIRCTKPPLNIEETHELLYHFANLPVEYWNSDYVDPYVQWQLAGKYVGQRGTICVGSNWDELLSVFAIEDEDDEEA